MSAIEDIVFVRYQVTDLDAAENFATDFGMHRSARTASALYMRGAASSHHVYVAELGAEPRAVGFGMKVGSEVELQKLAAETGRPVEENDEPGGGKRVRLVAPGGHQVDVMWGLAGIPPLPVREPIDINPSSRRTRMNRTVRLAAGPAHVIRLGHVAVYTPNLAEAVSFYSNVLGMRVADTYYAGAPDNRIAAFMRCGLGQRFTDHHTVALVQAPKPGFDHASFEVLDWDDLMIGHDHMQAVEKYKHSWGPGRHYDGSNIFDYWRDPFGHKLERYTDGDVVNDEYAPANSRLDPSDMRKVLAQWGPALSADFLA